MSYVEQIKQDMYSAMKARDKVKTNVLRTLLSSLNITTSVKAPFELGAVKSGGITNESTFSSAS